MKRIVCVGNALWSEDAAGPRVYRRLASSVLPDDVEVIDGGLAGLDLLHAIDGVERVVFVDAVEGYGVVGEVCVLSEQDLEFGDATSYDHAAGLAYLLAVIPIACERPPAEVAVVGIEGQADEAAIERAAGLSLALAAGGVDSWKAEVTRAEVSS